MKKILIITSSTRPVRNGAKVSNWVLEESKKLALGLEFEIIDLRELNLPFIDEIDSPMSGKGYIHEHTKNWSKIVSEAKGFIMVVPEYNGGYPAPLKNAIDFLYSEWNNKPVGIVGYGSRGALDAVRQLKEILLAMKLKPLLTQIGINKVWSAFDDKDLIIKEFINGDIQELFKEMKKEVSWTLSHLRHYQYPWRWEFS